MVSFTDLRVWQLAHQSALATYKATKNFPHHEQFGLVSQMRRAAVSVGSNIAEGYGRSSEKDREHFYTMASGSLYELKSQLLLARDLGYVNQADFGQLADTFNEAHKSLNALLKSHRRGKTV